MMKFALLVTAIVTAPTVTGLQAGYLSQLHGANGGSTGMAQTTPVAVPSSSGPSFGTAPAASAGPSQEMLTLWSRQVSVELQASQLYLSAYIWFSARDMEGMAAWMLDESGEEREHGLAILAFANKRKFPVQLEVVPAPCSDWSTAVHVWEDILLAEQTNTQNLLNIAAAANQCGDYAAMAFLNPFHMEQVDAEDKVGSILAKVTDATPGFMRQLDHELGMEAEAAEH